MIKGSLGMMKCVLVVLALVVLALMAGTNNMILKYEYTSSNNAPASDLHVKDTSDGIFTNDNDELQLINEIHQEEQTDIYYEMGICPIFNSKPGINSATSLWVEGLKAGYIKDSILAAPDNLDGSLNAHLRDLSTRVLAVLSPTILRRSIHHFAASPNEGSDNRRKITAILEKLRLRHHDKKHDKVKILVFGGSPTAGSNCYRNGALKKDKSGPCAWPGHLEGFLNAYAGFDAFEVVNYAIGASDSSLAVTMMQHGLVPESMKGPDHEVDIIIYAYSVNDFERYDNSANFLHDFVVAADSLAPCDGPRPITILLDDLVVNFHRNHSIDPAEKFHSEFVKMAQWHDLPLVSYSNVAKSLVLHNTSEELFVDYKKDSKHAPRGGHIAIMLTLAFNFLNMVQQHCDDLLYTTGENGENNKTSTFMDPLHLPLIESNPSLDAVTESWKSRIVDAKEKKSKNCKNGGNKRCAFAWVAMRKEKEHYHHVDTPQDIMAESQDWVLDSTWPPTNYGLKALKENATVQLLLPGTVRNEDDSRTGIQIESMGITYMKSYSEKWYNSSLHVDVISRGNVDGNFTMPISEGNSMSNSPAILASGNYSGFHETHTSEYYTESLDIHGHQFGEGLNVTFRMTGGSTFKIIGLTFC